MTCVPKNPCQSKLIRVIRVPTQRKAHKAFPQSLKKKILKISKDFLNLCSKKSVLIRVISVISVPTQRKAMQPIQSKAPITTNPFYVTMWF
jgi:protein-disulfide isomerase